MIRKNIYLTEKQIAFITEFIKNEGGGTETDVVRKALDEFIESKSSKYGLLLGCYPIKFDTIYLEISPRGSGKTYRLIKEATEYLDRDSKNKINIIVPSERIGRNIKQKIGEYYKNRIFVNENMVSNYDLNVRCFYDEFDFNNTLKNIDIGGYYCSTPSKIRKLIEFEELKKNDFLIKLLIANHGKYITYNGFEFFDYKHLEEVYDNIEYNNNWLKIK